MSSPRLVITSVGLAGLLVALPATTARRPRYGGTVRVEIGAAVTSLDPMISAANPEESAARWEIDSLINEGHGPHAAGFVFEQDKRDEIPFGPGPFHVTAFEAGKRVVLAATEDYRLGRPFIDSIEITMAGRAARERILDLELNKADFAEIPAEDARRAAEHGVRVSRSKPDELLALVFNGDEPGRGKPVSAKVREALALIHRSRGDREFYFAEGRRACGRASAAVVERDGVPLSTAADPVHAEDFSAQIVPAPKIVLGYDSGDSLLQAVAERIVVNAREAGIRVTARLSRSGIDTGLDAELQRWRMISKSPGPTLTFLQVYGRGAEETGSDGTVAGNLRRNVRG